MEKVNIVNVSSRTVTARGKNTKVYDIQLSDGRKGSSFDEKFLTLQGKESNIDVVQNGTYLNFFIPKEEEAPVQTHSPSESIKLALAIAVLSNPAYDPDKAIDIADKLYKWIIG